VQVFIVINIRWLHNHSKSQTTLQHAQYWLSCPSRSERYQVNDVTTLLWYWLPVYGSVNECSCL